MGGGGAEIGELSPAQPHGLFLLPLGVLINQSLLNMKANKIGFLLR